MLISRKFLGFYRFVDLDFRKITKMSLAFVTQVGLLQQGLADVNLHGHKEGSGRTKNRGFLSLRLRDG